MAVERFLMGPACPEGYEWDINVPGITGADVCDLGGGAAELWRDGLNPYGAGGPGPRNGRVNEGFNGKAVEL